MKNSFITPDVRVLREIGEFFAAGFCEFPDAEPIIKFCRGYRRWFENRKIEEYEKGLLYPAGQIRHAAALIPSYSFSIGWGQDAYESKVRNARPEQKQALHQLSELHAEHRRKYHKFDQTPHTIGGAGYTHAIINYGRVIREGISSYRSRIENKCSSCQYGQKAFYSGLLDVIEGMTLYHKRVLNHIENRQSKCKSSEALKLLQAFSQVPFKPARNYYEAMVCYNYIYYLDGCDNPGRIDQELFPFYQNDDTADRGFALELMRQFFDNVCANKGWSIAIGGSKADDSPAYNEITEICIEASHNKFRPSLELRVRDDMPEKLWQLSIDAISTGCGQPALYNENAYINAIKSSGLGVTDEDAVKWNGGGCTETMIHGCSNVGSLDGGINLLLILEQTLKKTLSSDNITFADIVASYRNDVRDTIGSLTDILNEFFLNRAKYNPQPIRSLFMDDCVDRGKDFNSGGARYNWSVINIAGIANVADSLEAVRELVFEKKGLRPSCLLKVLKEDFKDSENIRQRLLRCAKFGNDIDSVDSIAAEIAEFTYKTLSSKKCERGKFIPSHIMFETYARAGSQVGATPDGRFAKSPISDSSGPMQGNDIKGCTAMLKSVSKLPMSLAWGTPVLNMKFSRSMFKTGSTSESFRALITAYFNLGGMQVQVSVLDRDELIDALENPRAHENLIVRIGGYSTHFNWLSRELKEEVIRRTEYVF